jgi:hypothetical protein
VLQRAAAHGHGQHAQALQAAHQAEEVDRVVPQLGRQAREVDQHRILVEEVGLVGELLLQRAQHRIQIGGAHQQGHQRQVGALDFVEVAVAGHGHGGGRKGQATDSQVRLPSPPCATGKSYQCGSAARI